MTVQMARSPPSCRPPYQSSRCHPRTYILAYFIQKNNISNIFWALSEGPRGSTPTFSNPSPNETHLGFFTASLPPFLHYHVAVVPCLQSHPYADTTLVFPYIFPASLPPFYLFFEGVGPYLQRHRYTTIRFGFSSSPYLPYHFFPPLYLNFKFLSTSIFTFSRSCGA